MITSIGTPDCKRTKQINHVSAVQPLKDISYLDKDTLIWFMKFICEINGEHAFIVCCHIVNFQKYQHLVYPRDMCCYRHDQHAIYYD